MACESAARPALSWLLALSLLACAGAAWAAKPHQHGVATLQIAVDPGHVSVRLDIPLDNLLGFERAPRNDAERERAQAVVAQLRKGAELFRIDAAAGCTLQRTVLRSAELGLPDAAAAPGRSEHADLEADYEFSCRDSHKAGAVSLGLFDAFARLQRIEVQALTPRGQLRAVLQRPNSRVALAR
jgi:hypothetical protein